ncbi:hypothetical protein MBLNU13_g07200t1 [Cladosporium sp. NU13]
MHAESPYPRWWVGVWIMDFKLLEAGPAVIETAKDYARYVSITASPVVLACTTLSRPSYPADLSPTAAQGRMKPLSGTAPSTTHAGISSTAVRSVRGVPEWCALPIERATSNGRAIQALSHAPTDQTLPQPIMGRRRGVASEQGAEPPN